MNLYELNASLHMVDTYTGLSVQQIHSRPRCEANKLRGYSLGKAPFRSCPVFFTRVVSDPRAGSGYAVSENNTPARARASKGRTLALTVEVAVIFGPVCGLP